jgi:hypothetical protein
MQVLNDLRAGSVLDVGVPSLAPALPYFDLFSLVSLALEDLEDLQVNIFDKVKRVKLPGDHQRVQIHDALALPRLFFDPGRSYLLSPSTTLPGHYWRLPGGITPQAILAYLLRHVGLLHVGHFDGHEEIKLAIELHSILATRVPGRTGPSGGGGGSKRFSSVLGGGGLPSKTKGGRRKNDTLIDTEGDTQTTPSSLRPVTMSRVSGHALQAHAHRTIETYHSRTTQCATITSQRSPFVNRDPHHRFLSTRPHFHPQSGRAMAISHAIRRLMRLA